jgi:tRNA-2-methylthio-N6-dimethylallyladenosine synthase
VKTFAITTFGCQMNISDSERVAAVCKSMGYTQAKDDEIADLYVINTCSVRQKAEDRVLGMGKRFANLKAQKANVRTVLTGCMAKRDIRQGYSKSLDYQQKYEGKLQKQMPWLDYVLEINDIHKLPQILEEKIEEKVDDYFAITPKYDSKFQAYVPISTGCNKFCTFCIVPFTRGHEVYRPFEQIYNEVKNLVEKGYKEITLLGQNVNSWRSDNTLRTPITPLHENAKVKRQNEKGNEEIPGLEPQTTNSLDFADLMEALADIPGEFWLRFTSSHPYDINPRLIEVIAKKDTIAKHIHFALQSGSNTVLKRMNRYYTAAEFKEKVNKIRNQIPEVGLTTDVIVGFCGETEEEFTETTNLMSDLRFDQAFISEYSQREGTIAAKFYKDDLSQEVKADRKMRLDKVLETGVMKNNDGLIGTVQKVLVYKVGAKNKKGLFGRTTHSKEVFLNLNNKLKEVIESEQSLIGRFVNVKITGYKRFCLEGEII